MGRPKASGGAGPGVRQVRGSGGGLDADLVAQGLELADVGSDGALGAAVSVVVVGSEVTEVSVGIVEQVRPNINSLFYQPGDVGALASAILRLLKDPDLRRKLAEKSIPVLETINDYDTMASAYARLFRQAWLSGGPRQRHGTARQMAATR